MLWAQLRKKEHAAHGKLKAAFGKVADTLANALKARKKDVISNIGITERARANFAMTEATQSADWGATPQPLVLTIRALRVVRDKVLRGRYSVQVKLYDRLGGKVLTAATSGAEETEHWKLDDKTGPKQHAGRPRDDAEIFFNQPLEFVLPSEEELQPAMCFVFELVMLKGRLQARDEVVAWGAFPVCDATFRYVQGEFKTTMLYGEVNPGMDKYYKVEQAVSQDLDNWLCNLYFDIELAARQKDDNSTEFDQRLEYAQEVLRLKPLDEDDGVLALGKRQAAGDKRHHGSRGGVVTADRAARAELHLEDYRFSVQPRESSRLLRTKKPLDQMEVVRRNLAAEIYATQWRTTSFLGQIMLILSAFVLRHYLHYFGQLLYLEALGVPITKFAIRESGVVLAYDTQQLHPYTEMAVTVIGMSSVWIAQILFVTCAWLSMRIVGQFPDAYSMFLLAWCVVTFLDPFIILLNDIYHANWSQGDAFKCHNAFLCTFHMQRLTRNATIQASSGAHSGQPCSKVNCACSAVTEGDGKVGIGITIFLVGIHCLLTFCSSYLYLVNLHRNAQVQDILRRSEAQEGDFFVPEDDEISWAELVHAHLKIRLYAYARACTCSRVPYVPTWHTACLPSAIPALMLLLMVVPQIAVCCHRNTFARTPTKSHESAV
jgi:hypothetical protein